MYKDYLLCFGELFFDGSHKVKPFLLHCIMQDLPSPNEASILSLKCDDMVPIIMMKVDLEGVIEI